MTWIDREGNDKWEPFGFGAEFEINRPPAVKWYAWIGKRQGFAFYVRDGLQPNRFHRYMQWLMLGIDWERRDDSER